jgi:hypothetical protein
MGKVRDASKERYWRKLIRQQAETGETIARFCARQGVPVHQFYWWRRTLPKRDRPSPADRRHRRMARASIASKGEPELPAFLPVRLPFSVGVPIEVVHPGGCVLRVPAGFDPLSLRHILASLDPSAPDASED